MTDVVEELLVGGLFGTVIGLILRKFFWPEIRAVRERIFGTREDGGE
jgi:hypothetical protein